MNNIDTECNTSVTESLRSVVATVATVAVAMATIAAVAWATAVAVAWAAVAVATIAAIAVAWAAIAVAWAVVHVRVLDGSGSVVVDVSDWCGAAAGSGSWCWSWLVNDDDTGAGWSWVVAAGLVATSGDIDVGLEVGGLSDSADGCNNSRLEHYFIFSIIMQKNNDGF